jgi:hypothetical protein
LNSLKIQEVTQLDARVIEEMRFMGYDANGLLEEVVEGEVNERTAVYKMLRRKLLMEEVNVWQTTRARRTSRDSRSGGDAGFGPILPGVKPIANAKVRKRVVAPKVSSTPTAKLPPLRGPQ